MFIKQYELWQTCNNNCVFCFNKAQANTLDQVQQEQSLRSVLASIDDVVKEHKGNLAIELIGGEFFQGQMSTDIVRDLFFTLIRKLKQYGDTGDINQVCIFCTLTLGDQRDLFETIKVLTENKNKGFSVWISTSYDTRGRFTTESKLQSWQDNMLKLAAIDDIHRNTTIIFTQDFVSKVLTGELNLQEFQEKYKTTLFFKHPLPLLINGYYTREIKDPTELYFHAKREAIKTWDWFMPYRSDALKVMVQLNAMGILDRLMGLDYRADDLDSKFENGKWMKTKRDKEHNIESLDETKNKCGHLLTYMCYADSEACMLCDKESILNEV